MTASNSTVFVIIRGIPGSGKSTIARALSSSLDVPSTIIDPDEIDTSSDAYLAHTAEMRAQNVDDRFHPYRYLRAQARAAITNGAIGIWNQAFSDKHGFELLTKSLHEYADEAGTSLKILLIEAQISAETARARAQARAELDGRTIPDDAMTRFINNSAPFEGLSNNVTSLIIDAEQPIEQSLQTVLSELQKIASID